MKYLGMCFNWKVVVGLALVALGIWTLAPNLIGAALPVLIVLACPLSMLMMMRGMGAKGDAGNLGDSNGNASNQLMMGALPLPRSQRLAPLRPLSNTERLALLSVQLDDLLAEQHAIAQSIATLETKSAPDGRHGESSNSH